MEQTGFNMGDRLHTEAQYINHTNKYKALFCATSCQQFMWQQHRCIMIISTVKSNDAISVSDLVVPQKP